MKINYKGVQIDFSFESVVGQLTGNKYVKVVATYELDGKNLLYEQKVEVDDVEHKVKFYISLLETYVFSNIDKHISNNKVVDDFKNIFVDLIQHKNNS